MKKDWVGFDYAKLEKETIVKELISPAKLAILSGPAISKACPIMCEIMKKNLDLYGKLAKDCNVERDYVKRNLMLSIYGMSPPKTYDEMKRIIENAKELEKIGL